MKKKALAFALSLALCFGAAMPAFAAVPTSPEEAEKVQHTYEAYQIFTGTLEEGKLVDVEWGSAAKDNAALQNALWDQFVKDATTLGQVKDRNGKVIEFTDERKAKATASDYAYVIEKYSTSVKLNDTAVALNAETLAAIISTYMDGATPIGVQNKKIEGVSTPGWYLVVDTTADLIKVSNDEDYSVYKDRPQLQFTIDGNIEINTKHTKVYVDKKVADICDSATVEYDEWSESADYDFGDAVPFQVTGNIPDDYATYDYFEYVFNDEAQKGLIFFKENTSEFKYTVKIYEKDKKTEVADITDQVDVFELSDDQHFRIGFTDIKSIAKADKINADRLIVLEYKAILSGEGVVYGVDGNPNKCKIEFKNNVHGEGYTPWDIAIVFSFKPQIDKVNPQDQKLVGAKFKLYKWTVKDNAWTVVKDWDTGDISEFTCDGIDDGFYRIEEYEAPARYNKIDDIYFEVVAEHEGKVLKTLTVYETDENRVQTGVVFGSSEQNDGWKVTIATDEHQPQITTKVIDQEGVVLPSTGGIGTTIFYVVGGVLVVGAVVLLIVRRKMRTEEE